MKLKVIAHVEQSEVASLLAPAIREKLGIDPEADVEVVVEPPVVPLQFRDNPEVMRENRIALIKLARLAAVKFANVTSFHPARVCHWRMPGTLSMHGSLLSSVVFRGLNPSNHRPGLSHLPQEENTKEKRERQD